MISLGQLGDGPHVGFEFVGVAAALEVWHHAVAGLHSVTVLKHASEPTMGSARSGPFESDGGR